MRKRALARLCVPILIVAALTFFGTSDDGCGPATIMQGSVTVETEYGGFEVKVCTSSDEDLGELIYTFTLTNIDACVLESLKIEPFSSLGTVQLEPSGQWQPVFEAVIEALQHTLQLHRSS